SQKRPRSRKSPMLNRLRKARKRLFQQGPATKRLRLKTLGLALRVDPMTKNVHRAADVTPPKVNLARAAANSKASNRVGNTDPKVANKAVASNKANSSKVAASRAAT